VALRSSTSMLVRMMDGIPLAPGEP
jgi:hypothetical protein